MKLPQIILLIFLLAVTMDLQAQEGKIQEIKKRVKLDLKFVSRNSFSNTEYVFFWGVKAGFDLDRKMKFGFGYSWLQSRYFSHLFDADDYPATTQKAQPRFRYWSVYGEYEFYTEGGWEFSAPVELAIGNSFYRNDQQKRIGKGINVLTLFGLNTNYMFAKWFGFGVGLGYRIVLLENKNMKDQFTSPYYQVKFKVKLGDIFKKVKSKRKSKRALNE